MKTNRKILTLVISTMLILSVFSGCLNSGSGSSPASVEPQAPQSQDASTSEAPAGDDNVELSYMGWQPDLAMMNDVMIPAITEKYPNITVKVQILDWFAYWDKLTIETAAGGGPDIAALDVDHIPTYYDFFQPLDDLAAQVMGDDWASNYTDGVLDSLKVVDDTVRMMPCDTTGLWYLYYNKSLCDELGVAAPTGEYANLVDFVANINAAGQDVLPMAFAGKEDVNVGFFWLWLASNNQYGIVGDAAAGNAKFTDEPFSKAFTQIQEMMSNGVLDEKVFGLDAYPGSDDLFKSRKTVSYLTGEWSLGGYLMGSQVEATNIENDELGVVVLQNVNGGDTIMQKYAALGYGINKNCKNPTEAMQVAQEWTMGQGAQDWTNYQACVPAAKNIKLDSNRMKTQEAKNTVTTALDALTNNRSVLRSTLNSALDNKIGELVVSVLRMGMSPEDALAQLQQAADDLRD